MKRSAPPVLPEREERSWSVRKVEFREDGDALTLTGYASVFETPYEMYGGPPWGWSETVDAAAFDVTLRAKPDVQLLINHGDMPLARTKSGTLTLSADNIGLAVTAGLEPTDPDVMRLRPKMARGDMDEMSFAFAVKRQEWNEDYTERRLLEVDIEKGDVSIVNYGANPATSATLRSLEQFTSLAELEPDALLAELRASTDGNPAQVLLRAQTALMRLLAPAAPSEPRLSAFTLDAAKEELALVP